MTAASMVPVAYVSVDVDPVDVHLSGYGVRREPCDRVYDTAVPRMLDLLARLGIRATFFVIARDAERLAGLWREVAQSGHEIASHSLTHPLPFARLSSASLLHELRESRQRLEAVTDAPVAGFRAPGWDVDPETIEAIAAAGYRYDASVMPSPAYLAGDVLRRLLSRGKAPGTGVIRAARRAFAPRSPHRTGRLRTLWEFPVAVSPLMRVPLTHTLWYIAPPAVCRATYRAIVRRHEPLSYQFHAVDLLAVREDDLDGRIARHPGMQWPLARKLELLEQVLSDIAGRYRVQTFSEAVNGSGRDA